MLIGYRHIDIGHSTLSGPGNGRLGRAMSPGSTYVQPFDGMVSPAGALMLTVKNSFL